MNIKNGDNRFYNYVYCDPRKMGAYKVKNIDLVLPAEPFYVGRGCGRRKNNHYWEALNEETYDPNNHKLRKIRKIVAAGLTPLVVQLNKNLPNIIANENERYLVKTIGRSDLGKGPLTNLTDGGETSAGYKMSKEGIEKQKNTKKRNGTYDKGSFKGKKHTEESKEKNRQAHLGKPSGRKGAKCTPEQVERNRQKSLGVKQSQETIKKRVETIKRNNKLGKALLQFDLQGNFIKEHRSLSQANRDVGDGIIACIQGKVNTARNSLWVYKEKFDKIEDQDKLIAELVEKAKPKPAWNKGLKNPDLSLKRSRKVYQLNPETLNVIRSFDKIIDAEAFVGKGGIYQSMRKGIRCGGYKWKYA